jgi:anthranilate phosphoribosyltransferase
MKLDNEGFIRSVINRLVRGEHSNVADAERLMRLFVQGEFTSAQLGCVMMGMRLKGETADELEGFLRVYRENATPVPLARPCNAVDLCGTGGDGVSAHMFNISTTAAFVVAGAGVPVAKHGTVAVSSQSGSTDVLRELGINVDQGALELAEALETTGFCYMHGPNLNRAMRNVVTARRECGMRSFFNLLGPMANPAQVKRQVIGIYAQSYTEVVAETLRRLGSTHVLVVSSDDGLDELSISAPTQVSELRDGQVRTYRLTPAELGVSAQPEELRGGSPRENANILLNVLGGRASRAQEAVVVVNAGAAILVSGRVATLAAGVASARESIASRAALRSYENARDFSQRVARS